MTVEFVPAGAGMGGLTIGCRAPEPPDLEARAIALAGDAGTVVLVVGTDWEWESEGHDRESMELPGEQNALIEAVIDATEKHLKLAKLEGDAAFFYFAYRQLTAATGALLLFGAVQTSMLGYGLASGERLRPLQVAGLLAAVGGLVYMLLPGLAAPPIVSAVFMLLAGAS